VGVKSSFGTPIRRPPLNGIVNGVPKLPLAPEIALCGLDRRVAEKELDLLHLAAREMA
jgi:hypothetical protein